MVLFPHKDFPAAKKSFLPDFRAFSGALQLGLSSFITQLTIVVITLVCNIMLVKYGAVSQYGVDIPIAVIGIESKVFTVVINLVVGIVLGCQPIIGYNIGAKNYGRVKKLYQIHLFCTIVIGVAATLLFELAPDAVTGMFGTPKNVPNPDDYWLFGRKNLPHFSVSCDFYLYCKNVIDFLSGGRKASAGHRGFADSGYSMLCSIVNHTPMFMGIDGILYAAPIADCIAILVTIFLTVTYMRTLR